MAKRLKLAIIVVHYHTPELIRPALAAARDDVAETEFDAAAMVVDNGSTPDDRALWTSLDAEVVRPGANLGYAGALNLGVSRSDADLFVFMNPDVIVGRGCMPRLLRLLREGAAAAGPRFWWDHEHTMLLPPTERRTLTSEARRALATRSDSWAHRARQAWRAHALRHWRATRAMVSHHLSGGLLAVSRTAWQRVGPFDDGYKLYFEETDWLSRLQRSGLRAVYEPRAEAVHLHARSVAREPRAPQWFAESEARFRRRHYGSWGNRLLGTLARTPGTTPAVPPADAESPAVSLRHGGGRAAWVELSPGTIGFPAATAPVDAADAASWSLPPTIRRRLQTGPYTLQTVSKSGQELERVVFSVPDP